MGGMTHIVVGLGEVGGALRDILRCDGLDQAKGIGPTGDRYDVLHICFPWSQGFDEDVRFYQDKFRPQYTVIHSTVPIGTSRPLGALHSPVRGKHPGLKESLLTFKKYVGGIGNTEIVRELQRFGIPAYPVDNSFDTEAGKLLDLMQYGATILLEKEIHEFCRREGISFDVAYREMNASYNMGYIELGMAQFVRPILEHMDGKIGGHCVVQNMVHLHTPTAAKIIDENEKI